MDRLGFDKAMNRRSSTLAALLAIRAIGVGAARSAGTTSTRSTITGASTTLVRMNLIEATVRTAATTQPARPTRNTGSTPHRYGGQLIVTHTVTPQPPGSPTRAPWRARLRRPLQPAATSAPGGEGGT